MVRTTPNPPKISGTIAVLFIILIVVVAVFLSYERLRVMDEAIKTGHTGIAEEMIAAGVVGDVLDSR
jgi:hypothetical protein